MVFRKTAKKFETIKSSSGYAANFAIFLISFMNYGDRQGQKWEKATLGAGIISILLFGCVLSACNPSYLPITATGVLEANEVEIGGYGSFGYIGRQVRPLGFRGLVANFGVYYRKGVAEGVDWAMTLDNFGASTAFGFRQDIDADIVLRPRVGIGWWSSFLGLDYAQRISEGPRTDYAVGGSMVVWFGEAYWTDDPGISYGIRMGPMGQIAAEPRWRAPVSGGMRVDWAPLQFGGQGAPETIVDMLGGSRNPYAEPVDRSILRGWPHPIFAFEYSAFVITGGPAVTAHHHDDSWVEGGEKDTGE